MLYVILYTNAMPNTIVNVLIFNRLRLISLAYRHSLFVENRAVCRLELAKEEDGGDSCDAHYDYVRGCDHASVDTSNVADSKADNNGNDIGEKNDSSEEISSVLNSLAINLLFERITLARMCQVPGDEEAL